VGKTIKMVLENRFNDLIIDEAMGDSVVGAQCIAPQQLKT
jgi:hypothetical protein